MHCVCVAGEARRTCQVARLGDLEHRHARVLLVLRTEAAVIGTPVLGCRRRLGAPTRPEELPAPLPPLGVGKYEALPDTVVRTGAPQHHLAVAFQRLRRAHRQTHRAQRPGGRQDRFAPGRRRPHDRGPLHLGHARLPARWLRQGGNPPRDRSLPSGPQVDGQPGLPGGSRLRPPRTQARVRAAAVAPHGERSRTRAHRGSCRTRRAPARTCRTRPWFPCRRCCRPRR